MDSDDLLYLKEQMEAEEDAERLLRRTEKRAFAAFKISFQLLLKDEHLCRSQLLLKDRHLCQSGMKLRVTF